MREVLFHKKVLVLVNVFYWMPDYENVLQEFIWQTKDIEPTYPRVNKFLNYWKDNVDAVINEVVLSTSTSSNSTYRYLEKGHEILGETNGR
tara:strand:+ start:1361 stop:1633 length:273 start_codon:yes stop_codon:yes gene_type:complete